MRRLQVPGGGVNLVFVSLTHVPLSCRYPVRRNPSSADRVSSIQSSASRSHAALSKSSVAVLALARHSSAFRRYCSASSVVMPYQARSDDPFQGGEPCFALFGDGPRSSHFVCKAAICRRIRLAEISASRFDLVAGEHRNPHRGGAQGHAVANLKPSAGRVEGERGSDSL